VQVGGDRDARGAPVVRVPEAARQPLRQRRRLGREVVARSRAHQRVENPVATHEQGAVVALGGARERLGDVGEGVRLLGRAVRRGARRDKTVDLAPHLEHAQLPADIELGHQHAAARQHPHQPLAREPVQRLAHRRAAHAEAPRERRLRHACPGGELEGDDQLLEPIVGARVEAVGDGVARADVGVADHSSARHRSLTRPPATHRAAAGGGRGRPSR
jgi:hypothetical protein